MRLTLFRSLIFVLCCLLLGACSVKSGASDSKDELIIFTAASFAPVLQEINDQFEENNGVSITLNKAGTQELKAQLEQGAKADILISAREKDVEELKDKGLVAASEKLASNDLVIVISQEGSEKVGEINDIAKKGIRLVIAEENAPVGEFSRKLFDNLDHSGKFGENFSENVLSNVVSNESNEQNVLSKVVLGEADAGVVYRSSLSAIKDKEAVSYLEVDKEFNVHSAYYLVTLKNSSSTTDVYIKWMKSDESKELIKKYGFLSD